MAAQQTYLVDATGIAPLPVGAIRTSSLTAAAALAGSGDKILIQGLVDPTTGQVLGYSEQAWYPYQQANGAESFPILVQAGVTIKPANSTQVYIWSVSLPSALIQIQPPAQPPIVLTRIEDLFLIAGTVGIQARQSSGSASQTLLKNLVFVRNQRAVEFVAEGTEQSASVRNCQILDSGILTPMTPPLYQAQSVGLFFEARDNAGAGNPGSLSAEVIELTTTGVFANMTPALWNHSNDLERDYSITQATRLIEVNAAGAIQEHPGAPALLTTVDISDVDLSIQGGILNGFESGSSGWDVGLYTSASTGQTQSPWDYYAGYRVDINGTEFRNFRLAGILGTSYLNARGRIATSAQTKVIGTGASIAHNAGDYRHSGIHLFAQEGYLGFIGVNTLTRGNTGNGLWAHDNSEILSIPYYLPQGVFLDLSRFESHENDGNGIELRTGDLDVTGIVGGTAHYTGVKSVAIFRHLFDDGEAFQVNVGVGGTADLEFGQGQINRASISNNGEGGIYARSNGSFNDNYPESSCATISCRISNTFIWNNPRAGGGSDDGGVIVRLDPKLSGQATDVRGLCLLPITHCTLAANGGSASWNVEFEDSSSTTLNLHLGRYAWTQQHDPFLFTALYNSIFFRDIPNYTLNDFGSNFEADVGVVDLGVLGAVNAWEIGVAGIRAKSTTWSGDPKSNNSQPAPFVSFNAVSLLASNMFLNPTAGNITLFRNWVASYLMYPVQEVNFDYSGATRPAVLADRDKGGQEL